jgi:DNA-directed RNA polymerase subunit M/transcription elongation factor TFIIS
MPSPHPQLTKVSCPACGIEYDFPISMAGRRGRCAACRAEFTVPTASAPAPVPIRSIADMFDDEEGPPQYIAVECRLCQTRMYGRPDQVGQKLKCPDCGTRNEVPPPPKRKPKNLPAALEGDQYELWDAGDHPMPAALAATQPNYIAVTCRHCDTLMYATEKQVGQAITCPDCGKSQKVLLPAKPKPARQVLASDAEIPKLDPAAAPGERPAVTLLPGAKMGFEVQQDAEYAKALEESRRTGKPMRIDVHGHPIMPRRPLVTGVWRMLVTQEVIAHWIALSLLFGFAAQFLGEALLTPLQGMAEAIKLIFTIIGGVLAAAWIAMAAPLFVVIIGESADGEDKLNQPPRLLAFDWFGEVFSVVMAASVAGLCGLGVSQLFRFIPFGPVASAAIVTMVVVTVFPFALLSILLDGTPFSVLSPRLVSSLGRCTGAWILFFAQTYILAAVVVGAGWMLWETLNLRSGDETVLIWCLAPIAIAALIIDMRLLGRLAWWISDRMPSPDA